MRLLAVVALVLSVGVSGCGGDDDNGPSTPQFPEVAGLYNISGTFDDLTPQEANFAGTVQFTQATLESGVLGGNFQVTVTVGGSAGTITSAITSASITQGGAITWTVAEDGTAWQFSGNISGTSLSGRHTLSDGTDSFAGDWLGARTASLEASQAPSGQPARVLERLLTLRNLRPTD